MIYIMNQTQKIRIGIIGCGSAAFSKHLPAINKVPEIEVAALCDLHRDKAETAARIYGGGKADVYTDYKKMLEDKTIDAVHVCTQNIYHCPITIDALEAGKHVLCEKPMATTSEDALKMIEASKRTGKKLTVGYQTRMSNEVLYLKSESEKGTFGDIYYARAIALRRRAVPTWGNFIEKEYQGGGPLIDIGSHSLDLTLWIMNNYKPKYCLGTSYRKLIEQGGAGNAWGPWDVDRFTAEDSAFGFVVMENGATVSVESSWALNLLDAREATTVLCGTLAGGDIVSGVRINGVRDDKLYVQRQDFNNIVNPVYTDEMYVSPAEREAHSWALSIINDTEPVVLPEQAYCVTRILEGIYKSAETGDIYRF